jgi:G3E family GTPase
MQGDLIAQVGRLVDKQEFDHIIIEASGVSEPGNIVRGLRYPQLRDTVFTSAVLTLVDAEQHLQLTGNARYLADEQLAAADVVLLNKVDLVSPQQLAAVAERCACPNLPVVECSYADICLDVFFSAENTGRSSNGPGRGDLTSEFFESQIWRPTGPVDLAILKQVLQLISNGVVRSKGFVHSAGDGESWLVQGVGRRINLTKAMNSESAALVLIGLHHVNDWMSIAKTLDSSVVMAAAVTVRECARQANLDLNDGEACVSRTEGHT